MVPTGCLYQPLTLIEMLHGDANHSKSINLLIINGSEGLFCDSHN